MAETNHMLIRRFAVMVDGHDGGPYLAGAYRTRQEAVAEAAQRVQYAAKFKDNVRIYLADWELRPNQQIVDFGVDRFNNLLTDVWELGISLVGTLEEFIACGVIGSYVRDVMPKTGSKSSCDEFGNAYRLYKRGKGLHQLTLYLSDEPEVPHANARKKINCAVRRPEDVDFSQIFARIIR